jgi:hypothetical protein
MALAVVLVTAGCAAPSGGTVVTQGYYDGEYSIISPVTYGYDGVAGQDLNLYFTDTRTGETSTPSLTLVAPGGAAVPALELRPNYTKRFILPVTGRYAIQLRYPDADTGVRRYLLAVSRDEDRGPTGLGRLGAVLAGQRVSYDYAGTAGERLNRYGVTRIVGPGGVEVTNNGLRNAQVTLPVTGDYRLTVELSNAVISHDLAPIDAGLGATAVPELLPGQHVDVRYAGTAGEALGIGTSNSTYSVELRLPGDAPFPGGLPSRGTRYVLPVDGTYPIALTGNPNDGSAGTSLLLSADLDLGERGEGSWPAVGRVRGQSFTVTYEAPAGAQVRLRTLDPPGVKPAIVVTAPSGSTVEGVRDPEPPVVSVSDPWSTYTLSESGAHRILVIPASGSDGGSITLEIDALP